MTNIQRAGAPPSSDLYHTVPPPSLRLTHHRSMCHEHSIHTSAHCAGSTYGLSLLIPILFTLVWLWLFIFIQARAPR